MKRQIAVATRELVTAIKRAAQRKPKPSQRALAKEFGVGKTFVGDILRGTTVPTEDRGEKVALPERTVECEYTGNEGSLTVRSLDVKTLDDALRIGRVDLAVWEVDRYTINSWETTMRVRHKDADDDPQTYTNWQVKVWLRRKKAEVRALEALLGDIRRHAPLFAPIKRRKPTKGTPRRQLELDILDPHFGLRCYEPGADHAWTPDQCEEMILDVTERLLKVAEPYAPFEAIVWPFGNDFIHGDNVFHTTTQGTAQPEQDCWQYIYRRAWKLVLTIVERLRQEAPELFLYSVPGNHDRQSVFTIAQLIEAVYARTKGVHVDASASPYKFHHYGVNLIGFEHGHSIRQTVRLAALMANECRDIWAQTVYREWHLGDQHRKGSAKPSMHEEQGVSVEYLMGLTPPNEWHRLKSYNWQKRGAAAFVWDHDAGPVARLQINIDSYTGRIMEGRR